jgi:hypothetical protein
VPQKYAEMAREEASHKKERAALMMRPKVGRKKQKPILPPAMTCPECQAKETFPDEQARRTTRRSSAPRLRP